ncbi:hypothetical protein EVAR_100952_1 [Eumeta japonica]|uniref:Uncharacterized protein n=1 Tax=Eumeta variegata TaxID=151549 RepID=A0A4C2A6B3_EUMVA|nr:hypothetical protein EVAR_100952_1 [Eumeta japonica]
MVAELLVRPRTKIYYRELVQNISSEGALRLLSFDIVRLSVTSPPRVAVAVNGRDTRSARRPVLARRSRPSASRLTARRRLTAFRRTAGFPANTPLLLTTRESGVIYD